MSGQNIGPPAKVELVAWSGDVSQLAARLCLSESELMRRLKPLAAGRQCSSRLVVTATPANAGPILAALVRRMNAGEAA